jgi:hypothetical protein
MKIGYLVCTKCGSYYEIQPQDHPDEFSGKCECGGNIKFVRYNDFNDNARKIGASSPWEIKRKRDKGEMIANILVWGLPFVFGILCFYLIFSNWNYNIIDYETGGSGLFVLTLLGISLCFIGVLGMCGGFAPKKDRNN